MKIIIGLIVFKSNLEILFKNIDAIFKQSIFLDEKNSFELVILDNDDGAQIEEIKFFVDSLSKKSNSEITLLKQENIGFGAGMNFIFNQSKKHNPNYFLVINPDGIAENKSFENLINFAKKNNDNGIFEALQFPMQHPKNYDYQTKETKWCSGCCCLYPAKIFEQLNGFDESFFMYMEDVDLSWRARMFGYKCYSVDDAFFSHSVMNVERNVNKQLIMMQGSAYKLAIKYSNKKFAKKMLQNLSKLIDKKQIENLVKNSKNIKEFKLEKAMKKIPNFDNELYFSEARW